MKVETKTRQHEANLGGAETVAMGIDLDAMGHVMGLLTAAYADPELAVVREYATNALDAHVAAGITAPVEITTPTPLAPFFRVKDQGVGMSADDIRAIFSQYGASTKRDSNAFVGALGIGCKSALAYADQYTVTSTKGGRTVQVVVSRAANGGGDMHIVSDAATPDAPNGTEILVPAKTPHAFPAKCVGLFRYWAPGTVLVDGEAPEQIDGLWITPTILVVPSSVQREHVVVMGGVPYPVPRELVPSEFSSVDYSRRVTVYVEIGAVTMTPSRESLQDTPNTRAGLKAAGEEFARERDASVLAQIAAASDPRDALRRKAEGRLVGFRGKATWNGRPVISHLDRTPMKTETTTATDGSTTTRQAADPHARPEDAAPSASFLLAGRLLSRRVSGTRVFKCPVDSPAILLEGFSGVTLTPTRRAKLDAWAETLNLDISAVGVVIAERFSADERFYLQGREVYSWADVEAFKVNREGGAQTAAAYDCYVDSAYASMGADEIAADGRPVVYLQGNVRTLYNADAFRLGILDAASAVFVAFPANRAGRFLKLFPNARPLGDVTTEAAQKRLKELDPAKVRAYLSTMQDEDSETTRLLDASRVQDPALKARIMNAHVDTSEIRSALEGLQRFGLHLNPADYGAGEHEGRSLAQYPLMRRRGYYNAATDVTRDADHVYLYLNAAYAARMEADAASGKGA